MQALTSKHSALQREYIKSRDGLDVRPVGWFQMMKAKLFGNKSVEDDTGVRVTAYAYKGRIYISKVERCQT